MASGLSEQGDEAQVNTLIYAMGDEGDDILRSFAISADDRKVYVAGTPSKGKRLDLGSCSEERFRQGQRNAHRNPSALTL